MWLVIMNEVLTWEVMQRRAKQGPGICPLCREDEETINHLLIKCSNAKQVWLEVEVDQPSRVKGRVGWRLC